MDVWGEYSETIWARRYPKCEFIRYEWCGPTGRSRTVTKMHPVYRKFRSMPTRCKKLGISVGGGFDDWDAFSAWAYESGWFLGAHLDRIDNGGDYCPENCQWLSPSDHGRKSMGEVIAKYGGAFGVV